MLRNTMDKKHQRRQLLKQQYKEAAAREAASQARREAEARERRWQLIQGYLDRASAEQLHVYAASSHHDGNGRGLRYLADCPRMALGTAVMLFWLLGADWLTRLREEELRDDQRERLALLRLIERRAVAGFYQPDAIAFDPRTDCCAIPGENESLGPPLHAIAPCMVEPVRGRLRVDLAEAARRYDEGLAGDVALALRGL